MKNRILASWYLKKKFFLNILALSSTSTISSNLQIWSYYKLGMYNYVVNTKSKKMDAKAYLAKIVSYAALGKYQTAVAVLEDYLAIKKPSKKRVRTLYNALVPYIHHMKLNIENRLYFSEVVEIALLSNSGDKKLVLQKTKKLVDEKKYIENPELLLYYSNIDSNLTIHEKSELLNLYLEQFSLSKLKLIDKLQPVAVRNLSAEVKSTKLKELVTIIMTSYNSEKYIATAINSILNQSYSNIELIIVDDNSNDKTRDIVDSFVKSDNRVHLIKLKKNVGTYVAKNLALKLAKGSYITCHDSDDYSHPLKIELQVLPLIKNAHLIASISDWVRVDDNGLYYTRYIHPLKRMNLSSLMFKKDVVINKIGYYDSVRTGADSEYYARIASVFGKKAVKRVKKPLSFGAHRENSLMTANATGCVETLISDERLAYWESWNSWHIEQVRMKSTPYISFKVKVQREFDVPSSIIVPADDINFVQNSELAI